jgi:hypothetical protein
MTRALPATVLCIALAASAIDAQGRPAANVADRVAVYVDDFINRLSNVVAEEEYAQGYSRAFLRRKLHSQVLLVRPGGTGPFLFFRDVLTADGRPVGDHDRRLERLFATNTPDRAEQAQTITGEGARFNLPGVGTLNNPLIGIGLLQPRYRSHFTVELDAGRLRYTETARPTVLRGPRDGDLVAHVLVDADAVTGRVLRTELRAGAALIVTTFAHDARLGIDVPEAMRDSYSPERSRPVFGEAHYARYRRFTVTTDETITEPTPEK